MNNLGRALMLCSQNGEAVAYFTEALRLNPEDEEARRNLRAAISNQERTAGRFTDRGCL